LPEFAAYGIGPFGFPERESARIAPIGQKSSPRIGIRNSREHQWSQLGHQAHEAGRGISECFGSSVAERCRQGRTRTAGRDRYGKRSLLPDRGQVEISLVRAAGRAHPYPKFSCVGQNLLIDDGPSGGDNEIGSAQVLGTVRFRVKLNFCAEIPAASRIDADDAGPRSAKCGGLAPADCTQPHDDREATRQLKENGISSHVRLLP
jgi:hypothetical protein